MENEKIVRRIDLFCNDLYQFTCSYAYFVQNKHEEIATFDIFFRKYPFKGQYVIFAGLQSVKEFIRNFQFTQRHESYLKSIFPHMKDEYFDWLKKNHLSSVTVRGMKEGEIVFANEPLISYTGPLGLVQIFETPCLNLIGFASLVATNASRMVKIVHPRKCIEFGTRRAQGPDGAFSAAQYAYIGGFYGTSNVLCAQKFGLKCSGTMSHAYVTSFSSLDDIKPESEFGKELKKKVLQKKEFFGFHTHEGELASFLNFAIAFPDNFTSLIDTYETVKSGILNTIIVGSAMIEMGIEKIGIRLDSGDLDELSKECRKLWNAHVPKVRLTIVASDDLYQQRLIDLINNKSEIDIYAIGTNIATCKKQPALGVVCKLVELDGVPRMKLSSSQEKATYPCLKSIYRVVDENHQKFDLIALWNEFFGIDQQIKVGTIKNPNLSIKTIKSVRLLNEQIPLQTFHHMDDIRDYVKLSMSELPQKTFGIYSPSPYQVFMTQQYLKVFHKVHDAAQQFTIELKQKATPLSQLTTNLPLKEKLKK